MLACVGVEPEFYTKWGHDLLEWLATRLLDSDGLIMEALVEPDWAARRAFSGSRVNWRGYEAYGVSRG